MALFELTEKQRVIKNFIAVNIAFLLICAAYDDIAMIASIYRLRT